MAEPERRDPGGGERGRQRAREHVERAAERRVGIAAGDVGAGEGAARGDEVGHQPEQRHGGRKRDRRPSQLAIALARPVAVGEQERPGLGPQQRREEAEREGEAAPALELGGDGPQDQGDEQRLAEPAGELARRRG